MSSSTSVNEGWWLDLAAASMANAEANIGAVDPTLNQNGPVFATMAHAVGEMYGWSDARIPAWIETALDVRSASGGYGLGAVFDGNPANTDYLITTACFVAPHIAAAYDQLLVPQADFDVLLDRIRNWPTYAYNWGVSGQPGALPDYSSTAAGGTTAQHTDNRIWNVIAAAATFLLYNRDKHSLPAARTDALNKGTAWKNAIVWAMNRPTNFGGWGYAGVTSTLRQDGSHNWLPATMSAWLTGGAAPLRAQMAAGVVQGDIVATTTGTAENNYLAGAVALMSQHAEAHTAPASPIGTASFPDQLIGRVAASIEENASSANAGGHAVNALNCFLIHKIGLTL